jgi:hypothetical protein
MAGQPTPTVHIPLNISHQSVYLGTPELLLNMRRCLSQAEPKGFKRSPENGSRLDTPFGA